MGLPDTAPIEALFSPMMRAGGCFIYFGTCTHGLLKHASSDRKLREKREPESKRILQEELPEKGFSSEEGKKEVGLSSQLLKS